MLETATPGSMLLTACLSGSASAIGSVAVFRTTLMPASGFSQYGT